MTHHIDTTGTPARGVIGTDPHSPEWLLCSCGNTPPACGSVPALADGTLSEDGAPMEGWDGIYHCPECGAYAATVVLDAEGNIAVVDQLHCAVPEHDHTAHDDNGNPVEGVMARCRQCGGGAHHDDTPGVEDYQHDDPNAPGCFLTSRSAGATACRLVPTP